MGIAVGALYAAALVAMSVQIWLSTRRDRTMRTQIWLVAVIAACLVAGMVITWVASVALSGGMALPFAAVLLVLLTAWAVRQRRSDALGLTQHWSSSLAPGEGAVRVIVSTRTGIQGYLRDPHSGSPAFEDLDHASLAELTFTARDHRRVQLRREMYFGGRWVIGVTSARNHGI